MIVVAWEEMMRFGLDHVGPNRRRRIEFHPGGRLGCTLSGRRRCQALAKTRRQIDEVGDGHLAVVVQIAVGVGGVGFSEVGRKSDEVGDRNIAIAVEITFEDEE